MKKKVIAIDIDETLCTNKRVITSIHDYEHSKPIKEMIDITNKLFNKNYIILYTARGSLITNKNSYLKQKLKKITLKQLKSWKVNFHELNMNKIYFDILIDDKSINPMNGVKKILKEIKK